MLELIDNSMRAKREEYSLSSTWERAHISAEMRDAIGNLQSVYKPLERSFYDGPSDHRMSIVELLDEAGNICH